MPSQVRSAAIYARISSDQEGGGLGVARQVEDCQRLAADLGWPVTDTYVDNDISAYSGKARPEYRRMLADITDRAVDAVIVYHVDRLTRRPIELEEFVEALDEAQIRNMRFVVGDVDIGTGDGLLVARILSAMAANESATKSRRIRRKLDQVAAQGRPHGGSHRPFGYEDDRVTVRADEAAVIRAVAARFLAGESIRSLTTWLDDNSVRTVEGGPWRTPTVSAMLRSPRIAGMRQHRGQVIGQAVWDGIISEHDRARILARFDQQARSGTRSPRRYLLSGLLRCGKCGNALFSSPRANTRRYVCLSGPDHRGCGRLTVVAPPLEQFVADMVIYRLDTSEFANQLAGRAAADAQSAALSEALASEQQGLDELAELFGTKQITAREWMTAKRPMEERQRDLERRLARASNASTLDGFVGHGDRLRAQWADLNLTRQHAIIRTVLDHAVIGPGVSGARSLDPDRVSPMWRM
ncbi:MAG: site-specific recombinase [Frankiales bacterium]|jgi:DNA invertase Pin-like site-specific DNA recombinase|nr:site-specific recombinase [Frankiales bacterium]